MVFIWPNAEDSPDMPVLVLRKRDGRDSDKKDKDEVWTNKSGKNE
jgi:hypothetical protein